MRHLDILRSIITFSLILFIIAMPIAETSVNASTYIDVGDNIYDILQRLEAEGIIQSALLNTKPLSRKEIVRLIHEADRNAEDQSSFIRNQVHILKEKFKCELEGTDKYIKPVDKIIATYIHADDEPSELSYNNEGDNFKDGSNFRFEIVSRAELGWFSLFVNPEQRYSDSDTDIIMNKVYGVLNGLGWDLEIGTDSQWWGPGYHGSLLLSNNPDPLPIIKITNAHPAILPWVFKYLGPFKFTGFVTRLEDDRVVPEPYLWGMRINFKPSPYFEIGMHRTAILGGEGRSSDFSTWWKSFTGEGENDADESGDQRAGYDIKLTLPFETQPFQLYLESDGEDEAGFFPSKWAYLCGIYFPRLLNFEKIGFRAEYATTHVSGSPNVWYNHHIYQSGYTYKDRIIGHHMGTDSEDIFIEASYLIPDKNAKLSIFYDRKEHNLSDDVREEKQEVCISADIYIAESLRVYSSFGHGRIKNLGQLSSDDENIDTFIFQLSYDF